jgi:glycosyltransferase involved in cell wall biosynthesis
LLVSRLLAERGLAVCLIVYELPGSEVPGSVDGVDVVVRGAHRPGGGMRARLRDVTAVRRALHSADARAVITMGAGYEVGVVGVWAKLFGARFVFASASMGDFQYEKLLSSRRDKLLFRFGLAVADQIIVQTEEQIEPCKRRFHKTPVLIPSLSDPAPTSHREREAFLWAGRTEPNKQPLTYLELARALPDAHFWMVSRPAANAESENLWAQVEQMASRLPNVELLPPRPRPQLLELMQRAVAVVNTSGFEGVPNIFLEAWAHGTPALTLNHDPDGMITRHQLGGHANGQLDQLIELADHHWTNRHTANGRAHHYRSYVQTHHSPNAVAAAWARTLQLDNRAAPPSRSSGSG